VDTSLGKTSLPCLLVLTYCRTHKLATPNIKRISKIIRMPMLTEVIQKQEIDIILLQEVTPIALYLITHNWGNKQT